MAKKSNRIFLPSAVVRYLQTGSVLLLIALFSVFAYLQLRPAKQQASEPTPEPTEIAPVIVAESALLDALHAEGYAIEDDKLLLPDGTAWDCTLQSDPIGVLVFSVTLPLQADREEDGSVFSREFNKQNEALREQLSQLLLAVCPLYGGGSVDAPFIAQKCDAAQKKLQSVTVSLSAAVVQILPESDRVTVRFSRALPAA